MNVNGNIKIVLVIIVVLAILTVVFFGFFRQKSSFLPNTPPVTQVPTPLEPAPIIENPEITVKEPTEPTLRNTYTHDSFALTYPNGWELMESSSADFTLSARLNPLFDKNIAFKKEDYYLIIAISKSDEGGADGIFLNDTDLNQFINQKDLINIDNKQFYLTKNHAGLTALEQSHSGPYGWGSLFEYIPNKVTADGKTYNGYDQVISRSGNKYVFIKIAKEEGITPSNIQSEMIQMLSTIKW